jgi:hypothetical protein
VIDFPLFSGQAVRSRFGSHALSVAPEKRVKSGELRLS